MLNQSYWKVVLHYGHVGNKREVSVARYLSLPSHVTLFDVLEVAEQIPGVKCHGVSSIRRITLDDFLVGLREEEKIFYLIKLKSFSKLIA